MRLTLITIVIGTRTTAKAITAQLGTPKVPDHTAIVATMIPTTIAIRLSIQRQFTAVACDPLEGPTAGWS